MLTDAAIKKIKPPPAGQRKPEKYPDAHSLQLHVFSTGRMTWIYAYRFDGKQKNLTIGRYATVSLAEARRKRDEARQQIEQGIDPSQAKPNKTARFKRNKPPHSVRSSRSTSPTKPSNTKAHAGKPSA